MSELPSSTHPQSLFHQSAKLAIAAPIVALVLGIATQSVMKDYPQSALVIGGVNLLFLLTGFLASIVALAGIPKFGARGLLVRGIVGILFNGLFLAAFVVLILFLPNRSADARLTGKWETLDTHLITQHLTLQPDQHFQLEFLGPTSTAQTSGTWHAPWVSKDSKCYLVLKPDTASPTLQSMTGSTIAMPIEEVTDDHFTVTDTGHTQTYKKIP